MMIPIELIAYLVFALPSCVVLFRFAMMIYPEQALPVFMQVKRDINRTPTVAVIIPTYNEGQPVYEAIKSVALSKYPKDKLSIYPQDDGSKDDSYGWIMKASYDFPNVFPQENGENLGKTLTYIKGLDRSESDIVLIIDSDTTVAPEAINKIMANFADPRIGVVGAVCGTANPNHNILTAIQTQLYFFGQRLVKVAESHFQGVAVIGGYALAVRRQVLLELKPHILNRNWFGVIVKDGEDRFITHLALLRGWNTYVEQRAEIRTFAMDTYPKYFGQQLRWKRSLIRTFLWVMRTLPKQVKTINLAALFALCASAFTALVLFMMFLFIVFVNPSAIFEPMRLVHLVFITALVYTACLNVKQIKDQLVNNPFKMIMFLAWWIVNIFYLVLLSLFTLDQDAWGNREIKIKPIEEEV